MNEFSINSTITLNNNVKIPQFGLGVWQTSNKEAQKSVEWAIKHGYRLIDTAKQYGNEKGVGIGIKNALKENNLRRSDIFLTSKVFNGDQGYRSTLDNFEWQLSDLQTDYLDMLLIHWPVFDTYKETWRALEKLYKDGRVRAIGVSNFDVPKLQTLLDEFKIIPVINQLEFHPLNQEKEIKEFCDKHNIQLEAWSPLGGGQLLNNITIKKLASKYGKTSAQIILRWDLQRHVVTIPKTVHEQRIIENADIFDFSLATEDIEIINNLDEEKRVFWYNDFYWSGNPNGFKDSIDKIN